MGTNTGSTTTTNTGSTTTTNTATTTAGSGVVLTTGCAGRMQAQCTGEIGNGFGCWWDFEDGECEIGIVGAVNCENIFDMATCNNNPKCVMDEDECKTIGGNSEVEGQMEVPEEPEAPESPFHLKNVHRTAQSTDYTKWYFAAGGFTVALLSQFALSRCLSKSNPEILKENLYRDIDLDYSARQRV